MVSRGQRGQQDLTPSAYAVLGLLARRPGSGYELGSRAAGSIQHFWPLTRTHIYTELGRLEALGYVTATDVAQSRRPDKRVYTLAPAGARALEAWLGDPDLGVQRPRHPFLLKLFFAERVAPARLVALLARYRADALARRDRFGAVVAELRDDAPQRGVRATALLGLRRAEADLAWLDELPAVLGLPERGAARTKGREAVGHRAAGPAPEAAT